VQALRSRGVISSVGLRSLVMLARPVRERGAGRLLALGRNRQ
jgi:hypothetical protein